MAGIGRGVNRVRGRVECVGCTVAFAATELDSHGMCEECATKDRDKHKDDGCCIVS